MPAVPLNSEPQCGLIILLGISNILVTNGLITPTMLVLSVVSCRTKMSLVGFLTKELYESLAPPPNMRMLRSKSYS